MRHVPYGAQLLGRASTPADGRWQRGEVVASLYLADSPETATAEWYRSLAERGFSPQDYLPYDHHRWRLDLQLADLSDTDRLAGVGLDLPRPSRRSWAAFQRVGEQLWREGWTGTGRSQRRTASLADRKRVHHHMAAARLPATGRHDRRRRAPTTPRHDHLTIGSLDDLDGVSECSGHIDHLDRHGALRAGSERRFGHDARAGVSVRPRHRAIGLVPQEDPPPGHFKSGDRVSGGASALGRHVCRRSSNHAPTLGVCLGHGQDDPGS